MSGIDGRLYFWLGMVAVGAYVHGRLWFAMGMMVPVVLAWWPL